MSNQEHTGGVSRRTLIKSTALGSLALPPAVYRCLSACARRCRGADALTAKNVSSGAPVRSTAAAAAPCVTRA
jgi:hypothetical protein